MCPAGESQSKFQRVIFLLRYCPRDCSFNSTPPQSSLPPKFYGTLLACRHPSRPPPGPAGNNINSSLAPPGKKQGKIDSSGHRTRAPTRFRNGRVPLDQPRLTCYVKQHDDPETQWRIYLPDSMLLNSVAWFRQVLGHPGA